jgi:hypothetical protein
MMLKLTQTQMSLLSQAAAREDGLAIVPSPLNRAAAAKVADSLKSRGLMREVRARPDMPVWRKAEDRSFSLKITPAGQKHVQAHKRNAEPAATPAQEPCVSGVAASPADSSVVPITADRPPPRAGSKLARVIAMLSAEDGTTIEALVDGMGWMPHTTRATLTGLRKRGLVIERLRADGEPTRYRIVSGHIQSAG